MALPSGIARWPLASLRLRPSFGGGRERTGLARGGIVVPGALAQPFCPGSPTYHCLPTSARSFPPRPFLCFPEGSKYTVGSVSSLSKLTKGWVKAGACLGTQSAPLSWVLSLCPGLSSISAAALGIPGLGTSSGAGAGSAGRGGGRARPCSQGPVPSPPAAAAGWVGLSPVSLLLRPEGIPAPLCNKRAPMVQQLPSLALSWLP